MSAKQQPILRYLFRDDTNRIKNVGTRFFERNNLEWIGGSREHKGSTLSVMNSQVGYYYKTQNQLNGLGFLLENAQGFDLTLDIQLTSEMVSKAKFCLFCLVRNPSVTLSTLDEDTDLDLAVFVDYNMLQFTVRNTQTIGKRYLKLNTFITRDMIGHKSRFRFVLTNSARMIYYEDKLLISSNPKGDKTVSIAVSKWETSHTLFVGPTKTSKEQKKISLYEYSLTPLVPETDSQDLTSTKYFPQKNYKSNIVVKRDYNKEDKSIIGTGFRDLKKNINLFPTESTECDVNDSACHGRNDKCKYDSCFTCNGNNTSCPSFHPMLSPAETSCIKKDLKCSAVVVSNPHKNFNNLNSIINTKYVIRVEYPMIDVGRKYKINSHFKCKAEKDMDVPMKLDTKAPNSVSMNLNNTNLASMVGLVTMGELYECLTGKLKSKLKLSNVVKELEHLALEMRVNANYKGNGPKAVTLYESPCHLEIHNSIVLKQPSTSNSTAITGTTEFAQFSTGPDEVHTKEIGRDIINGDLVLYQETSYKRFSKSTGKLVSLQDINIVSGSGTPLFVSDISDSYYNPSTMMMSNNWHIVTHGLYFDDHEYLFSQFILDIKINNQSTLSTGTIAATYVDPPSKPVPIPPDLKLPLPKLPEWSEVVCLFNNPQMTIPYAKESRNQIVYFKISLVYKSMIPTYICGDPRCIIPQITLQIAKMGLCVPHTPPDKYSSIVKCNKRNGEYSSIMDFTVPERKSYSSYYMPKISDDHDNCSSSIVGSFIDRSYDSKMYTYPAFLELGLDWTTTPLSMNNYKSWGGDSGKKLKEFQTSSIVMKDFISPILIGGCPLSSYLTWWTTTPDCGYGLYYIIESFWNGYLYIMIFAFFILIICAIIGVCVMRSKHAHKKLGQWRKDNKWRHHKKRAYNYHYTQQKIQKIQNESEYSGHSTGQTSEDYVAIDTTDLD